MKCLPVVFATLINVVLTKNEEVDEGQEEEEGEEGCGCAMQSKRQQGAGEQRFHVFAVAGEMQLRKKRRGEAGMLLLVHANLCGFETEHAAGGRRAAAASAIGTLKICEGESRRRR